MIRTIDRAAEKVVQKVFKPDGTFLRYQAGIPGDSSTFTFVNTLAEARKAIGKDRKECEK